MLSKRAKIILCIWNFLYNQSCSSDPAKAYKIINLIREKFLENYVFIVSIQEQFAGLAVCNQVQIIMARVRYLQCLKITKKIFLILRGADRKLLVAVLGSSGLVFSSSFLSYYGAPYGILTLMH